MLLYDGRGCRFADRGWRNRFWLFCNDVSCGWGKPNHVCAIYDGWYYLCTKRQGCVRLPAVARPLVEPVAVYAVDVRDPDTGPWDRHERFTVGRSIISAMGLLPPTMRCMNCVQAIATLIGIHTPRLRTVAGLRREIERVC